MNAGLRDLCPILIHVGSNEVLRDDSTEFVTRARAAGVSAEVEVWHEQPHIWHALFFPEAGLALNHLSDFIRRHCP